MVVAFITELCRLGVYLDEVHRDWFVCGLNSKGMHMYIRTSRC